MWSLLVLRLRKCFATEGILHVPQVGIQGLPRRRLVAHYSHVQLPCRRTPFLFDLKSTFVCVDVEVLVWGGESIQAREGKKNSELLERQKVLLGAKREFEQEEKKSQILEQNKRQKTKKFLKVSFSLICILSWKLISPFSHICGVGGGKYIDNARGHVLVVIRGNLVRARPGEDSFAAALQMRRLVGLGARHGFWGMCIVRGAVRFWI